jgi:hypothetical protein
VDKAIAQYCMMMEHGFSEEMAAQEDVKASAQAHETWMAKIRGAISGDENAEPFQFNPQVISRWLLSDHSRWCA